MSDSSTNSETLREIDRIVSRYLKMHVSMDVGIGIAGLLPVPGIAKLALVGALALQAPVVYQPMVKRITACYARKPDRTTERLIGTAAATEASLVVATEFGYSFVKEHARELLHEQAFSFAASWLPVIGGLAAAAADAVIARKMTLIVAAMAVLYHENGNHWIESKRKTRSIVITALKTGVYVSFTHFLATLIDEYLGTQRSLEKDAKVDHASAVIDAASFGFSASKSVDGIDGHVLDALERLKDAHIRDLAGFKDAFTTKAGDFMDAGHMAHIKGYVGEEVASAHVHEPLPDDIRQEGWDLAHDGKLYQVKTGTSAYARSLEHLEKHPDQPIMSDAETVRRLHAAGHSDAVAIPGLENDPLVHATDTTAVSINELMHMHPNLPIVSTLVLLTREIGEIRAGRENVGRAIAKIAIQVGSRQAAIFLFTFAAVVLAAAAHILPVAGTFVAGASVAGGLTGKELGARLLEVRIPIEIADRLVATLQSLKPAATTRA